MIGIDLFAGTGGMALGAKYAGIDVHLYIEIDKNAASTYKHNNPNVDILVDNIKNVREMNLKQKRNYPGFP